MFTASKSETLLSSLAVAGIMIETSCGGQGITSSPYVTVFNEISPFPPTNINLKINSAGKVILLPNIASFVGTDTVAAAIAVEQDRREEMVLMIDLGTNGELILGNRKKLVVC